MIVTTYLGGREKMAEQSAEVPQHPPLDLWNRYTAARLIVDVSKLNGTEPPEWAVRIAANPPKYPAAS